MRVKEPEIITGSLAVPVGELPEALDDLRAQPHADEPPRREPYRPDWPRIIGNIGRTLIVAGVLLLLFVAYQLVGTSIQEQRAQNGLRGDFDDLLAQADLQTEAQEAVQLVTEGNGLPASIDAADVRTVASIDTSESPQGIAEGQLGTTELIDLDSLAFDPTEVDYGPPPPPPADSDAIARIRIPRIGVDKVVVSGVTTGALKKGPGHYPNTPLPCQEGNSAIAGHRTTYGAPFYNFDQLEENDLIYVTTAQGACQYRVTEVLIVSPGDVWVLDPTEDNRLTLTTCHPRFSARQRMIVIAELIGAAAPASADAAPATGDGVTLPGEDVADDDRAGIPVADADAGADDVTAGLPGESFLEEEALPGVDPNDDGTQLVAAPPARAPIATSIDHGLDGDRSAMWPAVAWGLLVALVWVAFWVAGRIWRRWPAYALGAPVFLLTLFFFFEDFSRLLPTSY